MSIIDEYLITVFSMHVTFAIYTNLKLRSEIDYIMYFFLIGNITNVLILCAKRWEIALTVELLYA